jgi:hypothetical protein
MALSCSVLYAEETSARAVRFFPLAKEAVMKLPMAIKEKGF